MQAKLQRRCQELTQTTPDQLVDDEAVYYKVAGECPKGRVYGLESLGRKKTRYADADASTSQVLTQRGMGNFMILSADASKSIGIGVDVSTAIAISSAPPSPATFLLDEEIEMRECEVRSARKYEVSVPRSWGDADGVHDKDGRTWTNVGIWSFERSKFNLNVNTKRKRSPHNFKINKKRRMSYTPTLPADVIEHIFSFLSPRDLIIRTSLLSKKWRDSWVSTNLCHPLSFEISSQNNSSIAFFQQFMKRRREGGASSTVLHRFSVEWCSFDREELLGNLITTALNHHVQELHISLPKARARLHIPQPNSAIPSLVFSAPKLRTLVLHNVRFTPGQNIICPDLESLVLKNSGRNSTIPSLVFSAPKLRALELHNVKLTPEQNIMALKLKTLVLDNVKLTLQQNIMNCQDLETLVLKNRERSSTDEVLRLYTANLKKLELENYDEEFQLHTP
ncbi:hypothetical protein Scep_028518 [Stephania cephalantha]|uniref:F-box domain-containing protein n=1 Tax=Stephania cephalantha TaxID=152367 RepID=A0AAP0EA35_9MAGN